MNKLIITIALLFIYYPYIKGMETYIYALTHPVTKEIKYIGKSDKPKSRLTEHIADAKKLGRKTKKEAWIKSLLNKGLSPKLEIASKDNWQSKEKEWIAKFDGQLKNHTKGGDGVVGYSHTAKSLEKMKPSWIKKGQRLSPKTEFKKGFKKGFKLTKEHQAKLIKANTGRVFSKETINKMRIAQKKSAQKRGLSQLMKGNLFAKGTKWTEKRRQEFTELRTGYKMSQETKDKIKERVSKPVIQYSKNNEYIKEWESAKCAAKTLGINYKGINNNLKHLSRISGGYIWRYKTRHIG